VEDKGGEMGGLFLELFFFICFLILFGLSLKRKPSFRLKGIASFLSFLGFLLSLWALDKRGFFFHGLYVLDGLSQTFKVFIAFGLFLVCWMTKEEEELEGGYRGEFYAFLTLSSLGLMMVVSALEFLTLFLALELSSYSLYLILPLRRNAKQKALEGAIKYVLFGAISSGITLYGIGYYYLLTGTTKFLFLSLEKDLLGFLVFLLVFASFFFKLSLFPFHFWAPDVYEGASNSTSAFIATVPKLGGLALLLRLSGLVGGGELLAKALWAFSVFSMTYGNLSALVQRDLKRLLAYSGIAHAGYFLFGVMTFKDYGRLSSAFYGLVYLIMTLGAFLTVILLSQRDENPRLEDLKGLHQRSPLLAFTLAVSVFSLVGIPPTGGFMGKLLLFISAFKEGYFTLVLIGAINTALSLFYYLNLVRLSYSQKPEIRTPIKLNFREKLLCLIFIGLNLFLGVFPSQIQNLLDISFTTLHIWEAR
jgi:NADH-quinone oxidoreductase subunit N